MPTESGDRAAAEKVSRQALPPKPRPSHQTVCDEPGEKDNPCFGHLKRFEVAGDASVDSLNAGEILFRCNRCYRLYHGVPMKFLR